MDQNTRQIRAIQFLRDCDDQYTDQIHFLQPKSKLKKPFYQPLIKTAIFTPKTSRPKTRKLFKISLKQLLFQTQKKKNNQSTPSNLNQSQSYSSSYKKSRRQVCNPNKTYNFKSYPQHQQLFKLLSKQQLLKKIRDNSANKIYLRENIKKHKIKKKQQKRQVIWNSAKLTYQKMQKIFRSQTPYH